MGNHAEEIALSIGEGKGTPFLVDARGTVSNTSFDLIGFAPAAAVRGEITYPADGTTEVFQVASSNVNDTVLGTGARTVEATYLDGDGALQQITVDLDGQTPVDLPAAFRIISCVIETSDTISTSASAKSTGQISIGKTFTLGVPSEVYLQIDPLTGQCNSGVLTIPANHRGVFQAAFASGPKIDEVEFIAFSRSTGEQWNSPAGFFSADNNAVMNFVVNAFGSLQDLELRAKSTSGPASVRVLFNVMFIPQAAP